MPMPGWIQIRVGEELLVRIAEAASRESRSISDWCRIQLMQAVPPVEYHLKATATIVPLDPNQVETCAPGGFVRGEVESTSEFSPKTAPRATKSPKEAHSEVVAPPKTSPELMKAFDTLLPAKKEAPKAEKPEKNAGPPAGAPRSEVLAWMKAKNAEKL